MGTQDVQYDLLAEQIKPIISDQLLYQQIDMTGEYTAPARVDKTRRCRR